MSIGDLPRNLTSERMKFLKTVGKVTAFAGIKINLSIGKVGFTSRKISKTIHSLKNPYHIDKMSYTHPEIGFQIYSNYPV